MFQSVEVVGNPKPDSLYLPKLLGSSRDFETIFVTATIM